MEERWLPIKDVWHQALYAPAGFYTTAAPADHFRTSTHVGGGFAVAMATLAGNQGVSSICDVGAGSGELLYELAALGAGLRLLGAELRPRPAGLPAQISWQSGLPVGWAGLIIANEWLDNVACDVVERAGDGSIRIVEVNRGTGQQRLGSIAPDAIAAWVDRWWPLRREGERAEVGLAREAALLALKAANPEAHFVVVDFGHDCASRPPDGSMSSYRNGRQTQLSFDGDHDIAAAVAFDALAATVGGTLSTQREALQALGVAADRPPLDLADTDPLGYLRRLAAASQSAELTQPGGLGDFYWLTCGPA